jgi:hypothetical protein
LLTRAAQKRHRVFTGHLQIRDLEGAKVGAGAARTPVEADPR